MRQKGTCLFMGLLCALNLARADYVTTVVCGGTRDNGLAINNCVVPFGANESINGIVGVTSQPIDSLISPFTIPCISAAPYFQNYELNAAQNSISVWGGCNGIFQVSIKQITQPPVQYAYGNASTNSDNGIVLSNCPNQFSLVSCSWSGNCWNQQQTWASCNGNAQKHSSCSVQAYCKSW